MGKGNEFTYSIAIRTLGTSGPKYIKLLESINNLKIKPEKIIVVLPENTSLPKKQLGVETFVFSKKGMILQRMAAVEHISSEYILFCDDDVEFEPDFVDKLVEPLANGEFDCSAGPLLSFFPPSDIKHFLASVLGGACVMIHGKKDNYVRILNTGGWSYNRNILTDEHKVYRTDSLPWTCFLIRSSTMRSISFLDEIWCERSGYAAFDDRIMFYKLKLNGYKSCVVSDASYIHNDGQTSIQGLNLVPLYARAFNHFVFWHRYLYSVSTTHRKRLWQKICIEYYIIMQKLYYIKNRHVYKTVVQGFKDARRFVKGEEYKQLPSVFTKEFR